MLLSIVKWLTAFLMLAYVFFILYQVLIAKKDLREARTWNPMSIFDYVVTEEDPQVEVDESLRCRFPGSDIQNTRVYETDGSPIEFAEEVKCSNCNQHLYKGTDGKCSLYEYDEAFNLRDGEEPIVGVCSVRRRSGKCPF